MLEYIPIILIIVFAAVMGWRNRISVEEYERHKKKKGKKKRYPSPDEQWDLFIKTKDTDRVFDNYLKK